jgi:hypothetical protein
MLGIEVSVLEEKAALHGLWKGGKYMEHKSVTFQTRGCDNQHIKWLK